jgi:transposase-like protein
MTEPSLLAVGDGGLGLWAALDEVFPETHHQRCWNHRTLNVLDKLPRRRACQILCVRWDSWVFVAVHVR